MNFGTVSVINIFLSHYLLYRYLHLLLYPSFCRCQR
nr:MAG TPA: hypothetical protein [Caudoviricetes sp.]